MLYLIKKEGDIMSKLELDRSLPTIYNTNGEMKFCEIAKKLGLDTCNVRYSYRAALAKIKKSCDAKTYTYLMLSIEGEPA